MLFHHFTKGIKVPFHLAGDGLQKKLFLGRKKHIEITFGRANELHQLIDSNVFIAVFHNETKTLIQQNGAMTFFFFVRKDFRYRGSFLARRWLENATSISIIQKKGGQVQVFI